MADNQLYSPSGLLLFDGKDFQRKHLHDFFDGAHANGPLSEFAPSGGGAGAGANYGYPEAGVTLPYYIRKIYTDLSVTKEHWNEIQAYLRSLDEAANEEGLITYGNYGDWLTIEPKAPHAILRPIQRAYTFRLAAE